MGAPDEAKDGAVDRRAILAARVVVVLHRELERAMRGADLNISQYRLMLVLKRGPQRASELAADSAIGKPAASALIAEMEREGLIERRPDQTDGRSVQLRLTPEGLRRHAAFERALAGLLGSYLPPDQADAVLEGMTALAYAIDARRGLDVA